MSRKLPIGLQDFEGLRDDGYVYVDKTEYIYSLAHDGKCYFLSRPRRFGKSLLLSAMRAYWEGKKELFDGLAIERLEEGNENAWRSYPVFYFDFNGENYECTSIDEVLEQHVSEWEEIYGDQYKNGTLGYRFEKLLEAAYRKTGLRCVVLVDEYDKPLIDVIEDKKQSERAKKVFKGFFSRLKKADKYIQFIFITGVSKFHKVSIFSDLNQLNDISLTKQYSGICGITDSELKEYFKNEISELALEKQISDEECFSMLRQNYDGYHFDPKGEGVYNPYSLLKSLFTKDFGYYWFETGTPTFVVNSLRKSRFDVRSFTDKTLYASESTLKDYTGDALDPVPILYQSGYLTITDYDDKRRRFTLGFPNEEVKYGFLESLIPSYVPAAISGNKLDIFTLDEYIENGDTDKVRDLFAALFANITYTLETDPFEHYFQAVIYLVFTLLGKFALCEMHTYTGRIDCKVETRDYIYLFEFKRDDTAESALAQIESNDYALPFVADARKIFKIGVAFDSEKRRLSDWKVAE